MSYIIMQIYISTLMFPLHWHTFLHPKLRKEFQAFKVCLDSFALLKKIWWLPQINTTLFTLESENFITETLKNWTISLNAYPDNLLTHIFFHVTPQRCQKSILKWRRWKAREPSSPDSLLHLRTRPRTLLRTWLWTPRWPQLRTRLRTLLSTPKTYNGGAAARLSTIREEIIRLDVAWYTWWWGARFVFGHLTTVTLVSSARRV